MNTVFADINVDMILNESNKINLGRYTFMPTACILLLSLYRTIKVDKFAPSYLSREHLRTKDTLDLHSMGPKYLLFVTSDADSESINETDILFT